MAIRLLSTGETELTLIDSHGRRSRVLTQQIDVEARELNMDEVVQRGEEHHPPESASVTVRGHKAF